MLAAFAYNGISTNTSECTLLYISYVHTYLMKNSNYLAPKVSMLEMLVNVEKIIGIPSIF